MKVLIATINKEIIEGYLGKDLKVIESTKNTCIFNISEKKFQQLYKDVQAGGFNPYALMTW